MNASYINKARIILFFFFLFAFFSLQCYLLYFNDVTNTYFLLGILFFSLGLAALGEKLVCDILLKAFHDRSKSNLHTFLSMKAVYVMGTILTGVIISGVMVGVDNFFVTRNLKSAFGLFGCSPLLLSVSFLLEIGRLVFINNEYIIYHQGLYKKVVAYKHNDVSVICIVEDSKKRQKEATIYVKNSEIKNKVIEDLIKNGLKEND